MNTALQQRLAAMSAAQRARLAALLADGRARTPKQQLLAYVQLDSARPEAAAEIRGFLEDRLPSYMIPTHIVVVDEMPRTPAGKVDLAALQARSYDAAATPRSSAEPANALEAGLCELWKTMLGTDFVDTDDDFFEIGGDSLLVTQLVSRIRRQFKVDLPVRAMFDHPTVAKLADRITELKTSASESLYQSEPEDDSREEFVI